MTLAEKGIDDWIPQNLVLLNRDQFKPEYLKLNPNGVVPTLIHDGRVIIDYTDDGRRYGPVYRDGKIALRQMQWMVAKYRNFRVCSLND